MRRLLARADQLQPGDRLLATGRTVVAVSPCTAARQVGVTVRNAKGVERSYAWGKDTEIQIDRPESFTPTGEESHA